MYVVSKQNILVQYRALYWGMCEPALMDQIVFSLAQEPKP